MSVFKLTFAQKNWQRHETHIIPFRRDAVKGEGFNQEAVKAFTRKANATAKRARIARDPKSKTKKP